MGNCGAVLNSWTKQSGGRQEKNRDRQTHSAKQQDAPVLAGCFHECHQPGSDSLLVFMEQLFVQYKTTSI
jgi:hypothetical protein